MLASAKVLNVKGLVEGKKSGTEAPAANSGEGKIKLDNDNVMKDEPNAKLVEAAEKPAVSERKLAANRENAQKSTGPRTAEGKRRSSFNSLAHGMLAKRVMLDESGKPTDPGLLHLLESLREKFGRGDVLVELLLEEVVVDYWRQGRALEHEVYCLNKGVSAFDVLSSIQRYVSGNRRALLQSLEHLDKLPRRGRNVEEHSAPDPEIGRTPSEEGSDEDEASGPLHAREEGD
jgi:hypothetical protein